MAKMTKRDTLDLVVKTFGVWLMALFIRSIPITFIQFTLNPSQNIAHKSAYMVLSFMHWFLYFLVSWFLLFKSEAIASFLVKTESQAADVEGKQPASANLWFWITIIGLYYVLSSASKLFGQLIRLTFNYSGNTFSLSNRYLWANVIMLILALAFIFKSKAIEAFINKRTKTPDKVSECIDDTEPDDLS